MATCLKNMEEKFNITDKTAIFTIITDNLFYLQNELYLFTLHNIWSLIPNKEISSIGFKFRRNYYRIYNDDVKGTFSDLPYILHSKMKKILIEDKKISIEKNYISNYIRIILNKCKNILDIKLLLNSALYDDIELELYSKYNHTSIHLKASLVFTEIKLFYETYHQEENNIKKYILKNILLGN